MTHRPVIAIALALSVVNVGCAGPAAPPRVDLAIAAAASLRSAVTDLTRAYAAQHPGISFTLSTGSSATLRTQIEQGSPVDVFLSADTTNPQALADAGLATGAPVVFAANAIALVVPSDNPGGITGPADLARLGARIIAASDTVPLATYAARAVEALAATMPNPAAFTAAVDANVVSREENAAAVLTRIELGDGDAAFVYATDAAAGRGVVVIPTPATSGLRAAYAGVAIRTSAHVGPASEFLAWVAGPEGAAVLESLGFLVP